MRPVLWISPRLAVAITIVLLVVVNVVDVRVAHAALVVGPVCAVVLLGLARLAGLSWQELGLGPGTWRRGLTWAAAIIGLAAIVLAAGAALPLTRDAFRDSRYHLDLAHALLTAFALIPVGTVLLEEIAFRGVLWGLLRRIGGTVVATAVPPMRRSRPQSTPRKAISSSSTVPTGISTKAVSSACARSRW